jgi:hypothetical protein
MKKLLKYISVFSICLAVAALFAHMIIPHDHHISGTFLDQEQSCPASNHQSGHTSGFPVHCYAFNDLPSEKARSFNISQNIQVRYIALVSSAADLISEPLISCTRIIDLLTPFSGSCFIELNHLRAPPFLA